VTNIISRTLIDIAQPQALFDHPNVVSLLGVVTVPRNIPALLVLEYCEYGNACCHAAACWLVLLNGKAIITIVFACSDTLSMHCNSLTLSLHCWFSSANRNSSQPRARVRSRCFEHVAAPHVLLRSGKRPALLVVSQSGAPRHCCTQREIITLHCNMWCCACLIVLLNMFIS